MSAHGSGRVKLVEEGCAGRDIQLQDVVGREPIQMHHQRPQAVSMGGDDESPP